MPQWVKLSMVNPKSAHRLWLNQALDDVLWTKANLKEQIWYGACFTAQQAAEKGLKAYLIYHGKDIKKIHDLGVLLQECMNIDSEFETFEEECATLTDYYMPSRYPDISAFMHFSKENAHQACLYAEKIVKFVQHRLSV